MDDERLKADIAGVMASPLTKPIAEKLARELKSIPWFGDDDVVDATARDLMRWCNAELGEREWSAERQAAWLVTEARERWTERWLGTAALKKIFNERFPPKKTQDWQPASYQELLARGLIRPPCERCDDRGLVGERPNLDFCTCPEGRRMRKWEGERFLVEVNGAGKKPRTKPPLDADLEKVRAAVEEAARRQKPEPVQ